MAIPNVHEPLEQRKTVFLFTRVQALLYLTRRFHGTGCSLDAVILTLTYGTDLKAAGYRKQPENCYLVLPCRPQL